jgi:hypothetical protein
MIDYQQETEGKPSSLQDSTVEDEMTQETLSQNNINDNIDTATQINDSEVLSQEDCSNRPDPPSIIDGEEEVPPRGDIPTAVSTLETNQSLLSEDDFSISDTQKEEEEEEPENDDEEVLPVNNDENGVENAKSTPEDSVLMRPNRIARDPSISLVDVVSPTKPQQPTSISDSEILQAVDELHVRRMTQPVWDDHDEDGLVRRDVGLQHVRERLTPRIELMPPIEERIFLKEPLRKQRSFDNTATNRRRIRLLLQEEMDKRWDDSFIGHIRRRSALFRSPVDESQYQSRGHITVSWYDGTSTLELNEHVRNSAMRKLKLASYMELKDLRFLDESVDPPEGTCKDAFGILHFLI